MRASRASAKGKTGWCSQAGALLGGTWSGPRHVANGRAAGGRAHAVVEASAGLRGVLWRLLCRTSRCSPRRAAVRASRIFGQFACLIIQAS